MKRFDERKVTLQDGKTNRWPTWVVIRIGVKAP